MGGRPAYGSATFCFNKAVVLRVGGHGAGTTGTIPTNADARNRVGTYIYPYEPATGSESAVGARGDRRQTPHTTVLLACHLKGLQL